VFSNSLPSCVSVVNFQKQKPFQLSPEGFRNLRRD